VDPDVESGNKKLEGLMAKPNQPSKVYKQRSEDVIGGSEETC
jgi:hypothetical protein